jgi:hypothetical protein
MCSQSSTGSFTEMAGMGASSNQDCARRGLVVLLVATAVVVYMALDPGWPFLASVVIFVAVVPALVWHAAGAIYPKGDSGPAVPIDRGSGNGFAIYLDAEPTGEMQGPTEMFLMINGGSLRSIERAGLTQGHRCLFMWRRVRRERFSMKWLSSVHSSAQSRVTWFTKAEAGLSVRAFPLGPPVFTGGPFGCQDHASNARRRRAA